LRHQGLGPHEACGSIAARCVADMIREGERMRAAGAAGFGRYARFARL
jgi:hypothetical protein